MRSLPFRHVAAAFAICCVIASCSKDESSDKPKKPAEVPQAAKTSAEPQKVGVDEVKADKAAPKKTSALASPGPAVEPQLLPRELINAGWLSLFDGKTLFGWKPTSESDWSVADGVITAPAKAKSFLMTTFQLADYEFQCDFRLEAKGNSGIFLRTPFDPKDPAKDCYELNLCDSHPAFTTGSIVARKKAIAQVAAEGDWKTLHVRVEGNHITAEIDGKAMTDFTDDSASPLKIGHIALQANGGKVEFKNIRLLPLKTEVILSGDAPSGWHPVPGSKHKSQMKGGVLNMTDGPGFLETDAEWKDFVLQSEFRINGNGLNSGIFFRAMQGTEKAPSNGYEFQIHNAFKDNDRSKPVDHGNGAIFRRIPARWVVGNDNEWVAGTLIANGPHFSTWVDGYQVVDWTDERKPNENPRNGLRLEAGRLILQAHDASTNVDFRNIKLAPLP